MPANALENTKATGKIRHLKHTAAPPSVLASLLRPVDVPAILPKPDIAPLKPVEISQHDVKPTAKPARPRRRHKAIVLSFFLLILVPVCLAAYYLWERAADQFASHLAFSVRTEETSSAIELLGGITELSGSSSSDTDILFAYLSSQELVSRVDELVDLRAIWSRVEVSQDPVFAFDPSGTIEDLQDHWDRKITTVYDSSTGLMDMRVLAFDPRDAQRVAQAILEESVAMINGLSRIAQNDAIRFTQEELENAVARLKTARLALMQFRNRTQIVDPSIDTQNQMGLLVTLQEQLAEALIDADLLRDTTRQNDPRVAQANRRIAVIDARISSERQNLGLGADGESGDAFASLVGEYEGLIVDREFAETAYTAARAAHDAALSEVRKQSRYLAAHIKPTLAQKTEYPERLITLAVLAAFCFFAWSIFCLVYYSLRDRS
jgi:capsular polysaccharide transport system permease protein